MFNPVLREGGMEAEGGREAKAEGGGGGREGWRQREGVKYSHWVGTACVNRLVLTMTKCSLRMRSFTHELRGLRDG